MSAWSPPHSAFCTAPEEQPFGFAGPSAPEQLASLSESSLLQQEMLAMLRSGVPLVNLSTKAPVVPSELVRTEAVHAYE